MTLDYKRIRDGTDWEGVAELVRTCTHTLQDGAAHFGFEPEQLHEERREDLNMPIDLGVGFDEAKAKLDMPLDIGGPYEFMVDEITDSQTGAGRDGWTAWLKVVNHPKPVFNAVRVPYNMYFPWTNPTTGQFDDGGINFITAFFSGLGMKWVGTMLPEKSEILGKTGFFNVRSGKDKQTGEDRKRIQIITKRKA